VLLGVLEQFLARTQSPFAPGRDNADIGLQGVIAELEAHLVIALAGGAMRDGIGAGRARDLDLALGDERAGDRCAQEVFPLVDGVGAEHGEDEVAHEFLAQVLDEYFLDAELSRLFSGRLEFFALADIGGEGDHLAAVPVLQPFEDDRGIQPAGVGEHDFFYSTGFD